jgi:hypothetical protein
MTLESPGKTMYTSCKLFIEERFDEADSVLRDAHTRCLESTMEFNQGLSDREKEFVRFVVECHSGSYFYINSCTYVSTFPLPEYARGCDAKEEMETWPRRPQFCPPTQR